MNAKFADRSPEQKPRSNVEVTRARILDAAARLFRTSGYAGATMRDVAKLANMQAGSLYYHFKSKEKMLEAVLDKSISELSRAVTPHLENAPSATGYRERLEMALQAHLEVSIRLGDYTAASRRLLGEVSPAARAKNVREREELGVKWRQFLEDARDAGEIRNDINLSLVRLFVVGAANFTHEWYDPKRQSLGDVAKVFGDMLFNGVAPRHELENAVAARPRLGATARTAALRPSRPT